ncbi:MAG TPA: hypothetical protein VNF08_05005 [Acidimicrobiales bacterium]|nr:hypothetical protein [Acidimicrobiales bacterium]
MLTTLSRAVRSIRRVRHFVTVLAVLALLIPTLEFSSTASAANSTWTPSSSFSDAFFSDVSCVTSSFCAAVGSGGLAVTYNGSSWSGVTGLDPNGSFGTVDCVTTTYCVAPDGYGHEGVYNGSSWSLEPTTFDGSSSCTSTSYCIGAIWSGSYETWAIYNSGSWTTQIGSNQLPQDIATYVESAISCASSSFCALALQIPQLLIYNGDGWSAPVDISSGANESANSVSCAPNTAFCVAVTPGFTDGYSWTYANGSWGNAVTLTGEPLEKVSCATTTFCVAVSVNGDALVYNGQSWGAPTVVASAALVGVSCPTTTFCAAVDDLGDTFIYRAKATSTTTTTTLPPTTTTTLPPTTTTTTLAKTKPVKKTITCHKRSKVLKRTGINPKCPTGFKK